MTLKREEESFLSGPDIGHNGNGSLGERSGMVEDAAADSYGLVWQHLSPNGHNGNGSFGVIRREWWEMPPQTVQPIELSWQIFTRNPHAYSAAPESNRRDGETVVFRKEKKKKNKKQRKGK